MPSLIFSSVVTEMQQSKSYISDLMDLKTTEAKAKINETENNSKEDFSSILSEEGKTKIQKKPTVPIKYSPTISLNETKGSDVAHDSEHMLSTEPISQKLITDQPKNGTDIGHRNKDENTTNIAFDIESGKNIKKNTASQRNTQFILSVTPKSIYIKQEDALQKPTKNQVTPTFTQNPLTTSILFSQETPPVISFDNIDAKAKKLTNDSPIEVLSNQYASTTPSMDNRFIPKEITYANEAQIRPEQTIKELEIYSITKDTQIQSESPQLIKSAIETNHIENDNAQIREFENTLSIQQASKDLSRKAPICTSQSSENIKEESVPQTIKGKIEKPTQSLFMIDQSEHITKPHRDEKNSEVNIPVIDQENTVSKPSPHTTHIPHQLTDTQQGTDNNASIEQVVIASTVEKSKITTGDELKTKVDDKLDTSEQDSALQHIVMPETPKTFTQHTTLKMNKKPDLLNNTQAMAAKEETITSVRMAEEDQNIIIHDAIQNNFHDYNANQNQLYIKSDTGLIEPKTTESSSSQSTPFTEQTPLSREYFSDDQEELDKFEKAAIEIFEQNENEKNTSLLTRQINNIPKSIHHPQQADLHKAGLTISSPVHAQNLLQTAMLISQSDSHVDTAFNVSSTFTGTQSIGSNDQSFLGGISNGNGQSFNQRNESDDGSGRSFSGNAESRAQLVSANIPDTPQKAIAMQIIQDFRKDLEQKKNLKELKNTTMNIPVRNSALGKVDVQVQIKGGKVSTKFFAEKDEMKTLLSQYHDDISLIFKDAGLELDENPIQFFSTEKQF